MYGDYAQHNMAHNHNTLEAVALDVVILEYEHDGWPLTAEDVRDIVLLRLYLMDVPTIEIAGGWT